MPPSQTHTTWNNLAKLYEEKFMDLDIYDQTYDIICSDIVKPNAKVLEIGCGPGNIARYLLAKRPDMQILGIDIAPNMIALAQRNNPKASFLVMDAREIDQLKETFDVVVCGFCLPYLSEEEALALIMHSSNILNPGGLIYLSFVEGNPEDSAYQESVGGRVFFQYHELNKLISHLERSNFSQITTHTIKYPKKDAEDELHTIVIATHLGTNFSLT